MGKIRFMAEEFFRSFRKNLFKNVLLMVMFSTSVVMTVLMGSYYLDLGELNSWTPHYQENGTWYRIGIMDGEDDMAMYESEDTLQGCQNIMDYYERLHDSQEHPIMSVDTVQYCYVRENDFQEMVGDAGYGNFVSETNPEAMMTWFGSADEGESCSVLTLKCAMLDDTAYEVFGLRTEEGEGFSQSSLTIQDAADAIPIVLGNEYTGIASVGDTIEVSVGEYIYPCRVAGILEKGSMIPWQGYSDDMVLLDSYIIFPYGVRVAGETDDRKDIAKYAAQDMMTLTFGTSMIWVKDEKDFVDVVSLLRDAANEYNYPPLELYAASMGLRLLHKESAARVRIMLILTLTLVAFTFYGLFAAFYDKIQSNKKTYGIYRMNGCTMGMLLFPYLLEIAVVLAPAVFVCRYIFSEEKIEYANSDVVFRVMGSFIGVAFLIGAVFVTCLLKGVDTEELIRQKD